MPVVLIVMFLLNVDLADILVGFNSGSLLISGAVLRQEFKVRIMGGIRALLVWVLLGSGSVNLLEIAEEPVVEASDTDSKSESDSE